VHNINYVAAEAPHMKKC